MARTRSTAKIRTTQFLVFTGLMIVLQALGAWLFPDRWTGATEPLTIVALSLLAAAVYVGIVAFLDVRRRRERDRAR